MSKTYSELQFDKSRKRLAQVLRNLEEVVKDKVHEVAVNAKMITPSSEGDRQVRNRIIEQDSVIQSLNEEIVGLQGNLSELGKASAALGSSNEELAMKFQDLKSESKKIVEIIEADLLKIEEVINDN